MSLDKATVARIAHLARITVPDEEQEHLVRELNGILGWVEQLGQVDTTGVEPMAGVLAGAGLRRRPDVVTDGGQADAVVRNAPDHTENFFSVPKVVE